MNCPSCSAPLLFGVTTCSCGYHGSQGEARPLELSYWEAFRAWWRIYWPTQVLTLVLVGLFTRWLRSEINSWRFDHPLESSPLESRAAVLTLVLAFLIPVICMWMFTPWIVGRPYRGFRLVVCAGTVDGGSKLSTKQHAELWFFVFWRQIEGGLLAMALAMPLNALLGTMGINASAEIAFAAGLFGIGPIIMKMLVGHSLSGFQIEARRDAVLDNSRFSGGSSADSQRQPGMAAPLSG